MNETELFLMLFIISFLFNMVFITLLVVCRSIINHFFGNIRNWLFRNKGWGYLAIIYPDRRIIKKYVRFDSVMNIQNKTYIESSKRMFILDGINTLFFNKNDAEPLKLDETTRKNDINEGVENE